MLSQVSANRRAADFLPHVPECLKDSGTLERSIFGRMKPELAQRALGIFNAIKDLPIIDPHTHYPSVQIADDETWNTPTACFLGVPGSKWGFDHYAATVMRGKGLSEKIVCGRESKFAEMPDEATDRKRWVEYVAALDSAWPNPSSQWLQISLERVFGVTLRANRENAEAIYTQVSEKLKSGDYSPQKLLQRHKVVAALTTDDPAASLDEHRRLKAQGTSFHMLPTFRPDWVIMIEGSTRIDFNKSLQAMNAAYNLQQLTDQEPFQIKNLANLKTVITGRMDYFKANGCIACDIGLSNFPVRDCTPAEADEIFQKQQRGEKPSEEECDKWKSHMLRFICTENARRQWTQYLHQGPDRDLNTRLFKTHGPDVGGDAPGEDMSKIGLHKLLDHLNEEIVSESLDGTGLAKTVIFNLNPGDYKKAFDIANRFLTNSAGIANRVQVGPPWWFEDTVKGNAEMIEMQMDRGILSEWIGMLSDARLLPSVIARIDQFRANLAATLINRMSERSDEDLIDLAKKVAVENTAKFLGLKVALS